MPTYNQYSENGSPSGMNYLAGDIKPWEDYVIFRTNNNTSVSIYGHRSGEGKIKNATVRTYTNSSYNGYSVSEETFEEVSYNINNIYYAYGNVIGMNYNLPSSNNISSVMLTLFVCFVFSTMVVKLLWKLVGIFR